MVGSGHQVADVVVGQRGRGADPGGNRLTGARKPMPRSASVPSQVTKFGSVTAGSGATQPGKVTLNGTTNHVLERSPVRQP